MRAEQENQVTGYILACFNTFVKVLHLSMLGLFELFLDILKCVTELVLQPGNIVPIIVFVFHSVTSLSNISEYGVHPVEECWLLLYAIKQGPR